MPVTLTRSQHAALLREAATCEDPELRASLSQWYVHAQVEPDPLRPSGDDSAWREAVEIAGDPFGCDFMTLTQPGGDPLDGDWLERMGPDPDPFDVTAEVVRCGGDVCSLLFSCFVQKRGEWLTRHP